MAEKVEEAFGNWCQCLTAKTIDDHLQTLRMKTNGSKFVKMNRLLQWLLGHYEPEDCQIKEGQDEYSLLIKREHLRTTFINEQRQADISSAWANITGESAEKAHPLTMLAEDKMTKANLEATRFAIQISCTLKGTGEKTKGDNAQQKEQQNSGNGINQSSVAETRYCH